MEVAQAEEAPSAAGGLGTRQLREVTHCVDSAGMLSVILALPDPEPTPDPYT